jgi:hypothetical protein
MKNLFDKFVRPEKYLKDKRSKIIEKDKKVFREKYEGYINNVQNTLADKNEISFLHAGHIGDIINTLPILKEISKTHTCNLFIQLDVPAPDVYNSHPAGKFFLNKRIYNMLLPLLKSQPYIGSIEIYNNQKIDIDFNLIRELPINLLFDNARYGFHIAGAQVDLSKKFLEVEDHPNLKNKITILRSLRYQNPFINYGFLEKFENLYYLGTLDEYNHLKKELKNLEFYECKNFLEMASIIKSSKVFIGNSSLGIDIADGLKTPRLLEASPYFPARQVHGENGFDFYFQSHFEKYFNFFNSK